MTIQNRQYYNNIRGLINERLLKSVGTHDQMFKKYKLTTSIIKKGTTVFVPHPNSDDDEYVQGTVKFMKDWHNQRKARYIVDIGESKPIEARPDDTFITK